MTGKKRRDKFLTVGANAVRQMNIGFFQGSGIGSLMSMLSVLFSKAALDSDKKKYEIPVRIFDLTKDSFKSTESIVESFSKIQSIFQETKEYDSSVLLDGMLEKIRNYVGELKDALDKKNQKVILEDFPGELLGKSIIFEETKMKTALKELIINAMKYSKNEDEIRIFFIKEEDFFILKILNSAYKNNNGSRGIRGRNKKLVFEPFYRLSPVMDDKYIDFEEFSFGLGLAAVKKIIELNNGEIFVDTIRDANQKGKIDVAVTVHFPLL